MTLPGHKLPGHKHKLAPSGNGTREQERADFATDFREIEREKFKVRKSMSNTGITMVYYLKNISSCQSKMRCGQVWGMISELNTIENAAKSNLCTCMILFQTIIQHSGKRWLHIDFKTSSR